MEWPPAASVPVGRPRAEFPYGGGENLTKMVIF
jgi:hypothetical protein